MQRYTSRNVSEKKTMSAFTKWGIALLSVSLILLFCIITNWLPFIRSGLLGAFGLALYPALVMLACLGVVFCCGKKIVLSTRYLLSLLGLYFIIVCVLQTLLTDLTPNSFGQYLSEVYFAKTTPGGAFAGIFAYGISALVNMAGALIIFGILAILCVALMIDYYLKQKEYKQINQRSISYPVRNTGSKNYTEVAKASIMGDGAAKENKSGKKTAAKMEESIAFTAQEQREQGSADDFADRFARKIFGDDYDTMLKRDEQAQENAEPMTISQYISNAKENSFENFRKNNDNGSKSSNDFAKTPSFSQPSSAFSTTPEKKPDFAFNMSKPSFVSDSPKQSNFNADLKLEELKPMSNSMGNSMGSKSGFQSFGDLDKLFDDVKPTGLNNFGQDLKPKVHQEKLEQLEMHQTKPTTSPTTVYKRPSPYVRPPLNYLTTQSTKLDGNDAEYKQNAHILEETLESFKISAVVESIVQGPAVTRYEIKMPAGISVNKIKQHADDIAMMMRSIGGVRIEAPIPGKNLVGIEIPNKKVATIGLKDVLDSPEFHNTKSALPFALGKDISGSIKICNLASMPHLLVAGSTGSGKSVCLNIIIISLLYKMGPDDLKLILIDPKRVEFSNFNGLPHLYTPEAICQPKQALNAFDWAIAEMDKRFGTFQRLKVRNFEEYNSLEAVYKGREPKIPRIVIIVDELADLMMFGKKDLEDKIMRIAQLARAAGIHLVIATQRPSVDVITGTIKTNLPSRIAFSLNSYQDSMTIINQGGAEKLLGKGDMLYFPQDMSEPVRIQCPYMSNQEINNIVDFIIKNNEVEYDDAIVQQIMNGKGGSGSGGAGVGDDDGGDGVEYDPILPKALFDFIKSGNASISAIQRRYSVGYARAARIVDQMEMNGFISPADGTNKRKVLIDENKYYELFSDGEFFPEE